jgi:hypothetical protein
MGESCIPAGDYVLKRTIYYKHGYETFVFTGAALGKRTRCLIHPGNTEEDVKGCVAVGMRRGKVLEPVDEDTGATNVMKEAVVESKKAFGRFMEAMEGIDEIACSVQWRPGLP